MPTKTANLNLDTYNSTTDAQEKFLTYRTAQNGVNNSNMTKLDAWAGTVNADITKLKSSKPPILLNATWASMGYYTITNAEVTEIKLDMIITLKLNIDNDGTTTIKINDLPIKSLMKYRTDGVLVNLEAKDLRINHEYNFRYDGTSFVWQGGVSADQITITGNTDEIITIAEDKTIQTSGVSVSDLATVDYVDTQDALKVDKTSITTSLTETVVGKVSDATVAKTLDDKISILNDDNLEISKVECAFKAKTYQLKGQMHCHTTTSDGSFTPIEILTRYKNAGYDFVALTDHDALNLNVDIDGVLHIRSTEFLQGAGHSHLCAYNITKMRDLTEVMPSQQGIIDFTVANGGLVSIAHPKMSIIGTKSEEATNLEEYSFVEVCTGYDHTEYDDYADVLLTNGKRINLLAVDDYHNDTANTFNYGYIVVNCDTKNKDDIMNELKSGNYYSSNGNNIAISKSGNVVTATSTSQSNFVFITNKGKTTTNNVTSATYSIVGDETYVRCIAIRVSDGKKAWSNPIILKHVKKQANNNILKMNQFYKEFAYVLARDSWFLSSNFAGATVTSDGFGEAIINSGSIVGGGDCALIYSVYNPNLSNKTHSFSGEIEKLTGNDDIEINVYASTGGETDYTCGANRLNKTKLIKLSVGDIASFKIDFTMPYGYTGFCVIVRTKHVNNSFKIRNVNVSKFNRNIINDDMLLYKNYATTDKVDISLLNGWVNYPQAELQCIKSGNIVSLVGIIMGGVSSPNTVIAYLPIGFRPNKLVFAPVFQYDASFTPTPVFVQIETDGSIRASANWFTKNTTVNLNFISV